MNGRGRVCGTKRLCGAQVVEVGKRVCECYCEHEFWLSSVAAVRAVGGDWSVVTVGTSRDSRGLAEIHALKALRCALGSVAILHQLLADLPTLSLPLPSISDAYVLHNATYDLPCLHLVCLGG